MRRRVLSIALLATVTLGCLPRELARVLPLPVIPNEVLVMLPPDLVVTLLEATGPATVNAQGSAELPIRVRVRNQGDLAAGIFKVSVDYTRVGGTFVVAFTVPGEANLWYPHTDVLLPGGDEVTFDGILTFHPTVHGEVSLTAYADSCSGDEFMPDYCRVSESDETNNESAAIVVILP